MALAQIATCPGQPRHNLDRHLEQIGHARAAGAHLVVFPELSLSGYLLAHGVLEQAMTLDDRRLMPLLEASRGLSVLVGMPLREVGGGISNAAVLIEDGAVLEVHRKLYLPTYGMFDEGRYFVPGKTLRPITSRLGSLGVLICEDAWHPSSSAVLRRAGADVLLVVAGGPTELDLGGEPAGSRRWRWIIGATALATVTPVLFVNRCGWEEGILFGGGSWAVDGLGADLTAPAPALDESLVVATLSRAGIAHARTLTPLAEAERFDLWRAALEAEHA